MKQEDYNNFFLTLILIALIGISLIMLTDGLIALASRVGWWGL